MKDLGAENVILFMEIKRDREKRKIQLNQIKYVERMFQRFNMQEYKLVKVPTNVGVRLFADQCPKTHEQEEDIPIFHMLFWLEVDVCNGLNQTIHCTCSRIIEKEYAKKRVGELDNNKQGFQVFTWHYQYWIDQGGLGLDNVEHTWLC